MGKKTKVKKIKPRLLRGFRDFLPDDMIAYQGILDTVRQVYERYGFRPQDTPVLEYSEVLTGEVGGETGNQIYTFTDRDDNEVGMRFDLTVPLSRVIAANAKWVRFPYKRYQYSRVWRWDKVTPGRYREFGQFDVDIVGSQALIADSEICTLVHDVVHALGFENFVVRMNSRRILNGLAQKLGLDGDEEAKQLFRELDKIDKQGWKKVRDTLVKGVREKEDEEDEDEEIPIQLTEDQVTLIEDFISLSSELQMEPAKAGEVKVPEYQPNDKILDGLKEFFADVPVGTKGVEELEGILAILVDSDLPEERFQVDCNIARGLDYYTGPIFETTLIDYPGYGSVFSGGRYDRLVGRFIDYKQFFKEFQEYRQKWKDPISGDPILPATGASLGVDRIFAIMGELGMLPEQKTLTEVIVITMDKNFYGHCHGLAQRLRKQGVVAELYTGESRAIKHQLRYADRLNIPLAVFYGENEHAEGVVTIKDLRKDRDDKSKQFQCAQENMGAEIKTLLAQDSPSDDSE